MFEDKNIPAGEQNRAGNMTSRRLLITDFPTIDWKVIVTVCSKLFHFAHFPASVPVDENVDESSEGFPVERFSFSIPGIVKLFKTLTKAFQTVC